MGEVYGVFFIGTALFALIAWLELKRASVTAVALIALVGVLLMTTFSWTAWKGHQECRSNPAYERVHPDYC